MSSRKRVGPTTVRRTRDAAATEDLILRAAETVFGELGYVDATVADIVLKAGISRGAFYLYFADKDAVFSALYTRVVNDLYAVVAGPGGATYHERVEAATHAWLKTFEKHRGVLRCLLQVSAFRPDISRVHNEVRTKFLERITRHIERNIANGQCHQVDPKITAYALGGMLEWVAYSWLSGTYLPWGSFEFDAVVRELTNIWCRAVYRDGIAHRPLSKRIEVEPSSTASVPNLPQ